MGFERKRESENKNVDEVGCVSDSCNYRALTRVRSKKKKKKQGRKTADDRQGESSEIKC